MEWRINFLNYWHLWKSWGQKPLCTQTFCPAFEFSINKASRNHVDWGKITFSQQSVASLVKFSSQVGDTGICKAVMACTVTVVTCSAWPWWGQVLSITEMLVLDPMLFCSYCQALLLIYRLLHWPLESKVFLISFLSLVSVKLIVCKKVSGSLVSCVGCFSELCIVLCKWFYSHEWWTDESM